MNMKENNIGGTALHGGISFTSYEAQHRAELLGIHLAVQGLQKGVFAPLLVQRSP